MIHDTALDHCAFPETWTSSDLVNQAMSNLSLSELPEDNLHINHITVKQIFNELNEMICHAPIILDEFAYTTISECDAYEQPTTYIFKMARGRRAMTRLRSKLCGYNRRRMLISIYTLETAIMESGLYSVIVGSITYHNNKRSRYIKKIDSTCIRRSYQGRGIVLNVYVDMVKRGAILTSGCTHSTGGMKLWQRLAKQRGIFMYAWYAHKKQAVHLFEEQPLTGFDTVIGNTHYCTRGWMRDSRIPQSQQQGPKSMVLVAVKA